MAVVSKVSKGTPITAAWANSLVTEANNQPLQSSSFSDASGKTGKGYQLSSYGAWHISCTNHGTVCLNAGQIYVNNLLVTPADGAWNGSYNQRCSCSNFSDFEITQCTKDTLPVFYIVIKMPVDVTPNNINQVSATLYKSSGENPTPPTAPQLEEDEIYTIIQLNEVRNYQIKQLISGSIFLNYNSSTGGYDIEPVSIIAGDGIRVDYNNNAYSVSAQVSIIPMDGIIVTNQWLDAQSNTLMLEVGANIPDIEDRKQISLIEGDGIIINTTELTDKFVYEISSSYNFDEEWFVVEEDGTISINEEKLEQEATAIAPTVSSQITTTATAAIDNVTDCGREGDIMLEVVTEGDSANARAWTEW